ncbi:MAG: hypothetical protein GW914_04405, partial [Candidatus Aenigmarchaeota archaeon]|nr:hypothetical protein [Candidatus Aenigmarchaeota archaeon]
MSPKAIATHTLFLIAVMGLLLIFTLVTFWFFIGQTPIEANKATCTAKYMNYCERWTLKGQDPGDWGDIKPEDCESLGIEKPNSIDDCK